MKQQAIFAKCRAAETAVTAALNQRFDRLIEFRSLCFRQQQMMHGFADDFADSPAK